MIALNFVVVFSSHLGLIMALFCFFLLKRSVLLCKEYGILILVLVFINMEGTGLMDTVFGSVVPYKHLMRTLSYSLLGPLFFACAMKILLDRKLVLGHLWHYAPSIGILLLAPLVYFWDHGHNTALLLKALNFLDYVLIGCMFPLYLAISFFRYSRLRAKQRKNAIHTIFGNLNFLSLYLLSISILTTKILHDIGYLPTAYPYYNSIIITAFICTSFIVLIVYFNQITFLKPEEVTTQIPLPKKIDYKNHIDNTGVSEECHEKYSKTGLSRELSIVYKERMLTYLRNEMPFLDNEISLESFAKQLNVSRHHLSQVINDHFDMNFNTFINLHRVQEARSIMEDNEGLNISDIGFKSGFNSRSAFFLAFKKHYGLSPSKYRKQVLS